MCSSHRPEAGADSDLSACRICGMTYERTYEEHTGEVRHREAVREAVREPRPHHWIQCWCGVNHAADGEDRCEAEQVIDTATCDHVAGHPGKHRFMGIEAEAGAEPPATPPALDAERLWSVVREHDDLHHDPREENHAGSCGEWLLARTGAALDVERLGFSDLLDVASALLTRYPPDTIVCSHLHRADVGARTVAAIADLVESARLAEQEGEGR